MLTQNVLNILVLPLVIDGLLGKTLPLMVPVLVIVLHLFKSLPRDPHQIGLCLICKLQQLALLGLPLILARLDQRLVAKWALNAVAGWMNL